MNLRCVVISFCVLGSSLIWSGAIAGGDPLQSSFVFTLDSVALSYGFNQPIVFDSLRGSIANLSTDSMRFIFSRTRPKQWIVSVGIGGSFHSLFQPDTLSLAAGEVFPVMVHISPYPESPDTEEVCFSVQPVGNAGSVQEHCIPLYLVDLSSVAGVPASPAVVLYPNPAASTLRIAGLEGFGMPLEYRIFSENGTVTAEGKVAATGEGNDEIDLRRLPSGAYRLQLMRSGQIITTEAFTVLR